MKLVDILARELKEWPERVTHAVQDNYSSWRKKVWLLEGGSSNATRLEDADGWCLGDGVSPNLASFSASVLAEDHSTAIVTRAQWQTAVEELRDPLPPLKNPLPMPNVVPPKQEAIDWSKAPEGATHWDASPNRVGSFMKVSEDGNYFWPRVSDAPRWCSWPRESDEHFIPRPMAWAGNGLPPINTICEQHPKMGVDEKLWRQVKVIAHVTDFRGLPPVAVFMPLEGTPAVGQGIAESFRVFKSEKEIAVEERKAEIAAMIDLFRFSDEKQEMLRAVCVSLHNAGYRKQVQP